MIVLTLRLSFRRCEVWSGRRLERSRRRSYKKVLKATQENGGGEGAGLEAPG